MSGAPELERSVLERKERNELQVIATSLGLKPGSRTKKADLVDQILRATGVDTATDGAGSTNGTDRRPKATSTASMVAVEPDPPESTDKTAAGIEGSSGPNDSSNGVTGAHGAEGAARGAAKVGGPTGEVGPAAVGSDNAAPPLADDATEAAAPANKSDSGQRQGAVPRQDRQAGGSRQNDRSGPQASGQQSGGQHSGQQGGGQQGGGQQGGGQQGARPEWRSDGAQRGNIVGEADSANRSRRRRRGRDRTTDRDFQAQERGADVPFTGEPVDVEGFLDLRDEGFAFLRTAGFTASPKDVYVSVSQVRRFGLRKGDYLVGASRPANPGEKFPALLRIDTVSGMTPDEARSRPRFEDLTPLFPDQRLHMETPGDPTNVTARIVDLMCPIGKGQRGLIVSPPKAGKTTVIKQIAKSIETNNPEVHLIVLLVDERPEEVTDMRRTVKGEVISSTFDRPSDEHTLVAELALERAKRLVEVGRDVVIILDGITRLTRAYNLSAPASGRLTSGGIDQAAIYPPKKFFGAARNAEEGGSLTILATALVETGSKADDVIFEELKGTGNMELRLDRRLAERRLYPAIDVNASSTRHEELLFERGQLQLVWRLRRVLNGLAEDGTSWKSLELLMDKIKTTKTNDEFLAEVSKTQMPV
jgi:transcription termination factor Rho